MGKYVTFDSTGFTNHFIDNMSQAMEHSRINILGSITSEFSNLTLRRMDEKFRSEMAQSIRAVLTRENQSLHLLVKAGKQEFVNQAFRVIYYEYGTGTKMAPKRYDPNEDRYWNPVRHPRAIGAHIYTRPAGTWFDAGGNPHVSKYKGKPRVLSGKEGTEGEEISPKYWFSTGMRLSVSSIHDSIRVALRKTDITRFIKMKSIRHKV